MKNTTPAVIYARFSPRPNAEECESVEKQVERCRAYCAGNGYDVIAEFHDKDLSGGRMDNRPGLQKAISTACRHKAILCVHSLSRLARCTRDAIDLAERLSAAGADLAVIQENVNTRSPMGRFIFTLFSALAQLEREQIGERTSTAMLRHQANGRRMTHVDRCPFGKQPDPANPAKLIDYPAEQVAVAAILAARADGKGLKAIARLLEARRMPCRGERWHHTTVRAILRRAEQIAEVS
jgi:DNA invertase Pin-like site-specific DNA recombinase